MHPKYRSPWQRLPRLAALTVAFSSLVVAAEVGSAAQPQLAAIDEALDAPAWDGTVDAASCDDGANTLDGCATAVDCGNECSCGAAVAAPSFGGCCWERTKLTGDWGGSRTALAASGLTLDADSTNYDFGNTSGGLDRRFDYAGHGDYVLNADMGKLGLMEGQFWKICAEHRWGQTINGDTGALLPATILPDLPVTDSEDVYLTNVLLTQAFSENFAVFAGKLDTLDGDTTAFASGRGKTQFSNMAFVANPIALRQIPYSTLGAGFVVLHELQPIFTFTVLNATDTARTSGFDELFNEGAAVTSSLRLPTNFFDRPGHQLIGGTWTSRDVVSLGQDPRIILPDVPIARQSDSWSIFWNCDQYLVVDPDNSARGWGYFARAGYGDDETDPIEWFLSAGLGGSSPLAGRPADTFGVGWYHAGTSDKLGPIIETAFGPIGDGDGVELFYNVAVTPWCHVTPDVQVLVPARETVDTALAAGVRANIDF